MERITVNLDDAVGVKVKAKAAAEKRSASAYVELLIEKDLRAAGLIGSGEDRRALVLSALDVLGDDAVALTVLQREARKKGRAA